jgi:hypothetical protein
MLPSPEQKLEFKQLNAPILTTVVNVMGTDIHVEGSVHLKYVPDSVASYIEMLKTLQLDCYPVQHALLLARASVCTRVHRSHVAACQAGACRQAA